MFYDTETIEVHQSNLQSIFFITQDLFVSFFPQTGGPVLRLKENKGNFDSSLPKVLENKRLDLDACKNKVRKARSLQMQQPVSENKYRKHLLFVLQMVF